MPPQASRRQTFTAPEAAVVTGRQLKELEKVFDEGIIERKYQGRRRAFQLAELCYVTAYATLKQQGLRTWSAPLKRALYNSLRTAVGRQTRDTVRFGELVQLDYNAVLERVQRGIRDLERARRGVDEDPEILGGEPVLRGTRVPVYLVADMVHQGADEDEILRSYPTLDREQVRLATIYARAHPKRGRPNKRPWH